MTLSDCRDRSSKSRTKDREKERETRVKCSTMVKPLLQSIWFGKVGFRLPFSRVSVEVKN